MSASYFTGRPSPRVRIDVGGSTWDIDTNGEAFVAMRHAGSTLAPEERPARVAVFTRYLEQARPADAMTTEVSAIISGVGAAKYPTVIDCPECPHNNPGYCDACDDEGKVDSWPDMRRTWVLSRPFDANLVAVSLEVAAAAGPCAIWIDTLDGSLVIDGADWRAVVMPMKAPDEYTRDEWAGAPSVFPQTQAVQP